MLSCGVWWGTTWYLTPRAWILSKTIQSIDWKIGCHMKTMFQRHSNLKFPFYFHVAYLFRHHFDQPARNLSVKPCSTQEDFTPLRIALRYVKARHQEAEYHSPWDHTENAGDFFGQKKSGGFFGLFEPFWILFRWQCTKRWNLENGQWCSEDVPEVFHPVIWLVTIRSPAVLAGWVVQPKKCDSCY